VLHYRIQFRWRSTTVFERLAISEPPPMNEQGNLRLLLGKRIKLVIATPSSIHAVIKDQFGLAPKPCSSCG